MANVKFVSATRVYAEGAPPAVDPLDLDIRDGEFLVLVGPSGSGKSTALRMLAGLEDVDGGRIYIGERDVTNVPPKDRDIAMVFQNYALYPHMTVAENMGFALKLARRHQGRDRPPGRGGRRPARPGRVPRPQAQGALRWPAPARRDGPGDRPRAAGLPDGRAAVEPRRQAPRADPRPDRRAAGRLGMTTVYVTHDQVEAMTMGHRVAVLQGRRPAAGATPRGRCTTRPANVFVAGFIGSPAMNLMALERRAAVTIGGSPLEIDAAGETAIGNAAGTITVGFRPEALQVGDRAAQGAQIRTVEDLGSEVFVHLSSSTRARTSRSCRRCGRRSTAIRATPSGCRSSARPTSSGAMGRASPRPRRP